MRLAFGGMPMAERLCPLEAGYSLLVCQIFSVNIRGENVIDQLKYGLDYALEFNSLDASFYGPRSIISNSIFF